MTIPILLAVAEIFGLFSIGAAARFLGYINEQEIDRWSRLVLDFLFPAFIFTSITRGFQVERLPELWPLPLIGLSLVVYGALAGMLFSFGLKTSDPLKKRTFVHFCAVNNSAYLPIIIVRNIWGEAALANLFFFNLGTTLGVWTIGVGVLGASDVKNGFKNLLTPTLGAVIASLVISISGLGASVPKVVTSTISSAGSAAVPLMLVLIGASLAQPSALKINWQVLYITCIRLIILPCLAILLFYRLPISQDVLNIAVIVSLMPVAVSSVIMTRRFGGSPEYAASTAFISTLIAIITVPVALYFLFQK